MKQAYVIAEAGVNHNGSMDLAHKLVDAAADIGADSIKFQTFKTDKLVAANAARAAYQIKNVGGNETQSEMLRRLELSFEDHFALVEHCKQRKIEFLSAPFDLESAEFLIKDLKISKIKIPSPEITNGPLLYMLGKSNLPLILSTGMTYLAEIEEALGVIAFAAFSKDQTPNKKSFEQAYLLSMSKGALKDKVTLLHCTTEYPTPFSNVNLRTLATLRNAFGLNVGLSDHTEGIEAPLAAIALGATVVEKHFTLDKNMPGPDHRASLDVSEFRSLVKGIRHVEAAMGSSVKKPAESELPNRALVRKSLVAQTDIPEGTLLTEENLGMKRPGGGINPMCFWDYVGTNANRSYKKDELIDP